ncbi:glycosyl transferase [Methylorubrum extorquens]|uniref:glycosyltransferase n=1 Tax=Methylorubrum extorquens TaxID=408 RepID=UPI001175C363|nr:glycosyltransferase [Methylorubrum extorquens]GEL44316.1 glycosyl transferase [Methylorubrum extorquens]
MSRKLLSVNAYHYRRGGSDVAYFAHAEAMERCGWEPLFFSMKHPQNYEYAYDHLFAERVDYDHDTSVAEKFRDAARIVYSLDARKKLKKLLAQHDVQIAHIHNIYHHISPSILPLLTDRKIPVVMTAHDLKLLCPNYKMLNQLGVCQSCKGGRYWNTVRYRCIKSSLLGSLLIAFESAVHSIFQIYKDNVSKLVVPSEFYRGLFLEWGWPDDKLVYIPNAVKSRPPLAFADKNRYILYFGRLSEEKGLKTLIEASARSSTPVYIAGTGPQCAELHALSDQIRAPVRFLGRLEAEALERAVAGSCATVLPSEWFENAPLSILESYSYGRPVIGARIGGIPELINDGCTGYTFQPGDPVELAELLRQVFETPVSSLASMGGRGRHWAELRFNVSAYTEAMTSLYNEL